MLNFIKKQGIAVYISAFAALLALIAMIFALVSSSVVGYTISGIAWVVVLTILTILLVASLPILTAKVKIPGFPYIGLLLSVVLTIACFGIIISARAYLVGTLWVTNLDSTNSLAVQAMNTATVAFVLYLLSAVLLVVASFFKADRTVKVEQTEEN